MKFTKIIALCALLLSSTAFGQFSFTADATSGCAPLTVNFTNTSTSGVHYDWNFGDGTPWLNDVTHPSHVYTSGGTFSVVMHAYNASYSYIGQAFLIIDVSGPPQNINISYDIACPGDEIGLNVWIPTATSWDWDFDDGSTASGWDYVEHAYASSGEYHPTVTVNTSDCGVFVIQDTVTITNSLTNFHYNANMYINPNTVCPGSEVNGQIQPGFSGYSWDFDNGSFGSQTYETWSYPAVGVYNPTLTITNGCGIDTVLTDVVTVSNTTPVQNPQTDVVDSICPGENFWAASWADDGVTFVWDMDDGNPTVNDSQHSYSYATAGTYNATVTITNDCGNQVVLNETIVVTPNAPVNNAYLDVTPTSVCPGDQVYLGSSGDNTYYIDYGDGNGSNNSTYHTYDAPGTYVVTATIQNACGNSVVLTDTVYVNSNTPIDPNNAYANQWPDPACPGTEVDFDASWGYASYFWDFDDGSTSTNQNTDHIFNAPGVYNVTCTITNGCGNSYVVQVPTNIQNNLPIAYIDLDLSADTICPGDSFFLEGNDNEELDHLWDLGDGTTSDFPFLSHSYATDGTYYITYTLTNACGNDSTLMDSIVVMSNYQPGPNSFQVFAQEEGCLGDELYFVVQPAGAGTITWDFGDGNSTSTTNEVLVQGFVPVDVAFHTYTSTGNYWAVYTITNGCGNSYTDSIEMNIGSLGDPQSVDATFWWDESQTACQGQPVEFMAVGGATYIWDFGDGSGQLVTYSSLTPVYHTYADPGSYTVVLNTINGCGNSDDSDENIFIPQSQMDITTNTVVESNCGDANGMAVASVSGGMPPYNFSWTNGDSGVIADSLSSGIYVLTVTDNNGCSNEGIATVSDVEGVTILVDNVVDVDCYGAQNGSISVSLLGGQPPYTILWSNGDQTEDIFGLQAGPYEIFVTDANGCFAVESIEVTEPAKSNVSIITTKATCGFSDGTATASVNNGTGPFNYIWPNTGGPSNTTGGLQPGIHTLLVIDGNTCLLEKDFAINEVGGPIIITDSTVTGTCNGTLSSLYISTIGGTQPFTYNWSNGTTNQDLTGVLPGDYSVEVTGSGGCSSYMSYEIAETQPEQPSICMVDVDTVTGSNLVVWEDLADPGIESYNIYKESSQAGLYYLVGNQSADSLSQFYDYFSDPSIRSWRYKVASVDDCGNESEWSNLHKTIHLTASKGISNDVNLIWDDYEGFAYPTFYINRYHPTTGWEIIDSVASNLFSYTDNSLPGDSSLIYMITIATPQTCVPQKAQDYNSSRSNRGNVNAPDGDDDLGIDGTSAEVLIYPNPTNGVVQIAYVGDISMIELYDMSGKLVYVQANLSGMQHAIDMSVFERGVYSLKLHTEEKIINAKVIRD